MNTRMSKYYNDSVSDENRSSKNRNLYKKIYEEAEYTNIEGIASIEKTNEIDLEKIKELLRGRDETHQRREFSEVPKEEEVVPETPNYDIKDVLSRAKETRSEDGQTRKLTDLQMEFVKRLRETREFDDLDEKEGLEELIHTITNTSMLNKMGDEELSLNMFSDLEASEETIAIEKEQIEAKTLDDSFYTSSLNFQKEDFEEVNKIVDDQSDKKFIKIISISLFILIIAIIVYVGFKFLAL